MSAKIKELNDTVTKMQAEKIQWSKLLKKKEEEIVRLNKLCDLMNTNDFDQHDADEQI